MYVNFANCINKSIKLDYFMKFAEKPSTNLTFLNAFVHVIWYLSYTETLFH